MISSILKCAKSLFLTPEKGCRPLGVVDETHCIYEPAEQELLINIKSLRNLLARDVMIPRVDIVAVPIQSTLEDVLRIFWEKKILSIFVYENDLDNLLGVVFLYDILEKMSTLTPSQGASLSSCVNKVFFISPSMRTLDLLLHMRETGIKDAIVIDEYGGVDGFISFDLLVEEIMGEIKNAHSIEKFSSREDGSLLVDGRTLLSDLEQLCSLSFDLPDNELTEEIDTISGFVSAFCGYVPVPGEKIHLPSGIVVDILESDARCIRILSLHQPEKK